MKGQRWMRLLSGPYTPAKKSRWEWFLTNQVAASVDEAYI